MRKLNIVVSAVAVATLLAPAGFGFAQSSLDLGVESAGLLPSNPFYFLKEWGRGFRKFISFNPLGKAKLELDVVNEKAAELKKLEEITPENIGALISAAENYKNAVEELRARLDSLRETSQNPNVDRLLNQLAERSLKHQQLFDDLLAKFKNEEELNKRLNELKDKLAGAVAVGAEKLDSPEKFRKRFELAVDAGKNGLKEIRAAELIDRVEEKLSNRDARKAAASLKDDLLIKFSGRLEGLQLAAPLGGEVLEGIPGDYLRRLKLLDEVREKVINPDLKSELNVLRRKILDEAEEKDGISKEEAGKAIEIARNLIAEAEAKLGPAGTAVRSSVKELIGRANFNLAQAEKFYTEESYGAAYGQATAAYAAAKSAWVQLTAEAADYSQALEAVKNHYDSLNAKVRAAGLNKENNPKLFELLPEAEKRIVELTRLIETKASPETISTALQNIKLILATIEEIIRGILEPRSLPVPVPLPVESPAAPTTATSANQAKTILVAILEDGFFPSVLRVSRGTEITWVNKDVEPHWPASEIHPTHQLLPGFDALRGLKAGETYSFVFEKTGSWKYHDHLNPRFTAVVEVVE